MSLFAWSIIRFASDFFASASASTVRTSWFALCDAMPCPCHYLLGQSYALPQTSLPLPLPPLYALHGLLCVMQCLVHVTICLVNHTLCLRLLCLCLRLHCTHFMLNACNLFCSISLSFSHIDLCLMLLIRCKLHRLCS